MSAKHPGDSDCRGEAEKTDVSESLMRQQWVMAAALAHDEVDWKVYPFVEKEKLGYLQLEEEHEELEHLHEKIVQVLAYAKGALDLRPDVALTADERKNLRKWILFQAGGGGAPATSVALLKNLLFVTGRPKDETDVWRISPEPKCVDLNTGPETDVVCWENEGQDSPSGSGPRQCLSGSFGRDSGDGTGKLRTDDGTYYGRFRAKKLNGPGEFRRNPFVNDGGTSPVEADTKGPLVYSGQWQEHQRCGDGVEHETETPQNKEIYDGQWKDDKRHGRGKQFDPISGRTIYDGQWVDGVKHGKCWQSRDVPEGWVLSEGEYREGSLITATARNDDLKVSYSGPVADNKLQADGKSQKATLTFHNGDHGDVPGAYAPDTYTGGVQDGKHHGDGIYTYVKDEKTHKGQWVHGQAHGNGQVLTKDLKCIYSGQFKGNKRNGDGCSPSYVGQWKDDKWEGEGTYTAQDGNSCKTINILGNNLAVSEHKGKYSNGKFYDKGKATLKNGGSYEGQFYKDRAHGKGTYTPPPSNDGNEAKPTDGMWKEGRLDS